jgi:eukaryotic-like serine/threonine-protein kinase
MTSATDEAAGPAIRANSGAGVSGRSAPNDASACPSDDELAGFVAGQLDEGESGRVEDHLDRCDSCRRAASAMAAAALDSPKLDPQPVEAPFRLGPGERLGRFTLTRPLGRGAMGEVWAARDPELDREVALKLLRLRPEALGEEGPARLRREAQAMARLNHPNVVDIYELGADREQVFCAMELIDGVTLRRWMAEPHSWREIVDVAIAAGRGLAAAHRAGLVHRDIKPDNVLMALDGRTLVTDFGLAKLADLEPDEPDRSDRAARSDEYQSGQAIAVHAVSSLAPPRNLTHTGVVIGTPAYMPPEQLEGGAVVAQSDQFSFCVTFYEALFGVRPFAGATLDELAAAARGGAPRPADRRAVPRRVLRCLQRGLMAERADRWPSMEALLAELERARAAPRRRRLAIAGVAALALASAAAILATRDGDRSADVRAAAESRISRAWSPARRASLAAALAATHHPAAAEVTAGIARALDTYRTAWLAMRVDAWAATNLRGEQSRDVLERRLSCLDRLADQLGALVAVLETIEAAEVPRAAQAVAGLAPLSTCADLDRLMAAPPTPTSPSVLAAERELRSLEALALAGRHGESLQRGQALLTSAEKLGDAGVLARAAFNLGSAQANSGQVQEAEKSMRRAVQDAARARDHQLVAEIWIQLVALIGSDAHRLDEAAALAPAASAAVAQAGNAPRLRADLATTLGTVDYTRGDMAAARDDFTRALDEYRAAFGPDHPRVANAEANLGAILVQVGPQEEAARRLERAITIMRAAYGEIHPVVGKALSNLATLDRKRQDWPAFERHARAARDINLRVLGDKHPDTARTWKLLGQALLKLGRLPEARTEMAAARRALAAVVRPEHPQLASIDLALGQIAEAEKDWAAAEKIDRAAVASLRRQLPPGHAQLAYPLAELARMVAHRSPRDSLPIYDEAMRIHTSQAERDRSGDVETLAEVARAALAANQPDRGLVWFERMPEAGKELAALKAELEQARKRRRR